MKQCIGFFAATLLTTFGISAISFGQSMYAANTAGAPDAMAGIAIKENVVAANNETNLTPLFAALFPNATEQKWSQRSTYSFVSFLNNGRKTSASFSAKGKLNYVTAECSMEQLPEAFAKTISKNYAGYNLFYATEIKAYGQTAYQAIIENASRYITLKYTVDGMETMQTIGK